MNVIWSNESLFDLHRPSEFLRPKSPRAAGAMVLRMAEGAERLAQFPRLGEHVEAIEAAEIRSFVIGDYEMYYEILDEEVVILRVFHTREER